MATRCRDHIWGPRNASADPEDTAGLVCFTSRCWRAEGRIVKPSARFIGSIVLNLSQRKYFDGRRKHQAKH